MGRGSQSFTIGNAGRSALAAALLAATALPASMALTGAQAFAQSPAQTRFDVPAGPLSRALAAFGSQSGTQLSYEASVAAGKTSAGMRGAATRAGGCMARTLSGDFANNQIPPKYMISLDVSQKLFDDALTLGGRVTHYGKRAIEGSAELSGATTIITPIDWKPFTLVDVFAEYRLNENLTMNLAVENLTDQYYIDPLSLGIVPAPGRTVRAGLTARF